MTITSVGLKQLGFISQNIRSPNDPYDFVLQNDGSGTYIAEWNSAQVQPTASAIEAAHIEWQTAYDAEQDAKAASLASAKTKLSDLGLTTDEVKEAFGI